MQRSLEDRLLARAIPRVVNAYTPLPEELSPGVWTLERRLRHFGLAILPSRTTVLRCQDDGLAVVSPPSLANAETIAALDRFGTVRYVIIPNSFHYLYAAQFMEKYPSALLIGAPGLRERAPGLGLAAELPFDAPEDWAGVLEYLVLGPDRGASEALFFHVASKTLILTDLAFNMSRYPRTLDRIVWQLSGIPRHFGPGRTSRSLLMRDEAAVKETLTSALDWPFERIIVAHGEIVEQDARARFEQAFSRYL